MASIKYNLRYPKEKISPIQLDFHFKGHRIRLGIGESILSTKWSSARQRAKESGFETKNGRHYLNDFLETLKNECLDIYKDEVSKGVPDPTIVEQRIKSYLKPEKNNSKKTTLYNLIDRFINNEITAEGKPKTEGTLKVYKTTRKHLKEFEAKENYRIDFDSITMDFYHKFTNYLIKQKKLVNTVGKQISVIKSFMNAAVELKLTDNLDFRNRKFKVYRVPSDAVYLNDSEIIKFYTYDFTQNERLEKVRDLFVFGCLVGLRYSDYSTIKPENILKKNDKTFLQIKTQKTGEIVYLPCHPIVLQLFEKYKEKTENSLPTAPTNQKFNEYIKEAAKIAGFTETGRLASEMNIPLNECISSHTARRSFATNYYRKIPKVDLMKITGHKNEKSFNTYIKTNNENAADLLSEVMDKEYTEHVLRVVQS